MNKILRYSFIALLALVCNVTFGQEVTLDFTDNTNWKFPDGNDNKKQMQAILQMAHTLLPSLPQQPTIGFLTTRHS